KKYIKIIRSLNYLFINIKLNITFTVNKLYEINTNPTINLLIIIKYLFRYLIKIINISIVLRGKNSLGNIDLKVYNDILFINNLIIRYNISGYIIFLAGGPVF
ncbi:hypothetical protein QBC45DRAFT_324444, partial [Copromyces sp. CBS 386.78]